MQVFGIDVSKYQGDFDFTKAKKEGIEFVIIKAGGSDGANGSLYTDVKFERNYKAAKAVGIPVGAYYYLNAKTVADAKAQGKHYITQLSGKQFEYPVMVDIEGWMADLPGSTLEPIIRAFCETVEKAGYWVGMYFGLSVFYWHLKDAKALVSRYTWWLPYWGSKKPNIEEIQIWQYGGETNYIRSNKIAGVICDQDYAYKDFPSLIKSKGLNGFKKTSATTDPPKTSSTTATPRKTIDQLADEVMAGKYGNDPQRSAKIKAEGYDPVAVQRRVDEKYYGASASKIGKGDRVKVSSKAVVYGTNLRWQEWVYSSLFYVASISGSRAVISVDKAGLRVTGPIDVKYLSKA